jgi:hypothetical protein
MTESILMSDGGAPATTIQNTLTQRAPHEGVLTPRLPENPVVSTLKADQLYLGPDIAGSHLCRCPFCLKQTPSVQSTARYVEPTEATAYGSFQCPAPRCADVTAKDLIDLLNVEPILARHRPQITIHQGELHEIINAAEYVLAARGKHYQAGGLIVSVGIDPATGDPSLIPTSLSALMREMSDAVVWLRPDTKTGQLKAADPPKSHLSTLYEGQTFTYLNALDGLARQPYFREADGQLVDRPGYDAASRRLSVFDANDYTLGPPTLEAARAALAELDALLDEFHFVNPEDRAAALSAIFAAVTRPSLPLAPAYHVKAPVFGSGKTYLCELIGAFAGPRGNTKLSYPTTAEEATKAVLSVLLGGPAVVEFDDMSSDWAPHGVIMRMLTAERISDRVLGYSKTATVSTRTLFLGSGNNVGPVKDLLRRVVTIQLDARTATPATLTYKRSPVEQVRSRRPHYVSLVLTIIRAWKAAGSPRDATASIASYGGAWSDHCRHPLVWLGHPDPAHSLFDQIRHDPDAEALGSLLHAWYRRFGSKAVTVRRVLQDAIGEDEIVDVFHELNLVERGIVNRSKVGWFLKKNANRIVDGMEFKETKADGRKAYYVACHGGTAQAVELEPQPSVDWVDDIPF